MALFTVVVLVYSALSLYALHKTTRNIANSDLPSISSLIKLRTSLLTQESYAGKYAILKDRTFIELYRQREKESLKNLGTLDRLDASNDTATLKRLFSKYRAASARLFDGQEGSSQAARSSALQLLNAVDALYVKRQDHLQAEIQSANYRQESTIRWTIILSCAGFLLAIGVTSFVTYRTFRAIQKLQRATHRIAEGDFDYDPQIPPGDEIGDLARDFTRMAARLKELERNSLDASPLTRLPGNIAIERVLDQRLKSGRPFAFCYADLDNFKPFSDHYGYAKGSDLLRATGDLILATVKELGDPAGFVGHVGGDDFVMVLTVDEVTTVCEAVIKRFDAEAAKHFSPEDEARGGIEGTDRYGVHRFFPTTTISIAVIICGEEFASAVDIARAAAEVKDSAKETPGSNYLICRQQKRIA